MRKSFHDNAASGKIISLLIWLLATIFVFSGAIEATTTRSAGMSIGTGFEWMLDNQFGYIYQNPAALAKYEDLFFGEYAKSNSIDQKTGGVFFKPVKSFTFGIISGLPANAEILNGDSDPKSLYKKNPNSVIGGANILTFNKAVNDATGLSLAEGVALFENTRNLLENRNLTGIFSFSFSKNFQTGFAISYSFASEQEQRSRVIQEDFTLFKSETFLAAGLSWLIGDKVLQAFDLGAQMFLYSIDNNYDETDLDGQRITASYTTNQAYDFSFFLKFIALPVQRHKIHTWFQYNQFDTSTYGYAFSEINKDGSVPFHIKEDYLRQGRRFSLGLSDEITAAANVMMFAGFRLDLEKSSNDFDSLDLLNNRYQYDTTFSSPQPNGPLKQSFDKVSLPIIFGLEGRLSPQWMIRFGFSHDLLGAVNGSYVTESRYYDRNFPFSKTTISREYVITEEGAAGSSARINLGLSYFIDALQIDWLGNVNFFNGGPFSISGQAVDLSTSVAVIFYLGKLEEFTR